MKVALINYTKDPEKIVAQSARLCYSALGIEELRERLNNESIIKLIKKIMELGHYSVLEHATFTFAIEGISRVTSHQLVRHRLVSFSQQSQRYVKINKESFPYIIPKSIEKDEKLSKIFVDAVNKLDAIYQLLLDHNIKAEDARY
ncbi:MAG: FAD-dependent thymidylate synthase, partial [Atribacterota bacterium]|nr:FAD-dependent thymidylate synthase [Atribacterota bacterium]